MTDTTTVEKLELHARFARRVARGLLGDEQLAEDAVQETWLAAVRSPPRVLSAAWIGAVVRNAALKLRRSESRRTAREKLVASRVPEAVPPPERHAVLREVMDAVLALDEPYRTTVVMRFYEGLPPREIAVRLGVSVSAVNSRLQRALADLRSRLDDRRDGWRAALFVFVRPVRTFPAPRRGPGRVPPAGAAAEGVLAMGISAKAVAGLAAAATLGLAWLLVGRGGDVNPTSAPAAAPEQPASAEPGAAQRALPTRPRATAPVATDGVASPGSIVPEDATRRPDVAGVVLVPEGAAPTGGFVYVAAGADTARRILARASLGAGGAFEITLPREEVSHGLEVEVGAVVPGLKRNAQTATLLRGETRRVEIRLVRGLRISGTVVDTEGAPVAQLPLLARPMQYARRFATGYELDTDALLAQRFDPASQWARAVTDASGRFSVDGLSPGGYGLLAENSAWILMARPASPMGLVAAGSEDVRVVARPTQSAVLRVRDAKTGAPLWGRVRLVFARRHEKGASSSENELELRSGELRIAWDLSGFDTEVGGPDGEVPSALTGSLKVAVEGYERREVPLRLDAKGVQALDAPMDRIAEETLASVRLEVVDVRGQPFDVPMRVGAAASESAPNADRVEPSVSRLRKVGAGRFVWTVSPGRWSMRLSADDAWGGWVGDATPVEVFSGGSTDLRVTMPPWGFLVVRRAGEGRCPPLQVRLSVETSSGTNSWSRPSDTREVRFRVPVGTFRFTSGVGANAKTREVAFSAFADTVVELEE